MFDIKSEEILTCLLLIVVGYCIAKMFSRSCNGFSVGGQNSGYQVFEPDPTNYPDIRDVCGYKYKNGDPFPGSFLNVCGSKKTCVCLDKNKNITKADMDDASKCRVNNNYGGRCMSNDKLDEIKNHNIYPKFKLTKH